MNSGEKRTIPKLLSLFLSTKTRKKCKSVKESRTVHVKIFSTDSVNGMWFKALKVEVLVGWSIERVMAVTPKARFSRTKL